MTPYGMWTATWVRALMLAFSAAYVAWIRFCSERFEREPVGLAAALGPALLAIWFVLALGAP